MKEIVSIKRYVGTKIGIKVKMEHNLFHVKLDVGHWKKETGGTVKLYRKPD